MSQLGKRNIIFKSAFLGGHVSSHECIQHKFEASSISYAMFKACKFSSTSSLATLFDLETLWMSQARCRKGTPLLAKAKKKAPFCHGMLEGAWILGSMVS